MNEELIFHAALEIADSSERQSYLDRVCAGNPQLRLDVDELLLAHESSEPSSAKTTVWQSAQTELSYEVDDTRLRQVGPYRILERIGEGGMAVVYRAEQTAPVQRQVALKVVKRELNSNVVRERFGRERQTLARMQHPHVASVLDGGNTDDGRPYLVMQLVDGIPITEFCSRKQMPLTERLRLFIKVCSGVQHAHQKGIVHRDLKPSNVLVIDGDDGPRPMVIDFGIAKALEADSDGQNDFTQMFGVVGTPLYMSPEQLEFGNSDIDTRADVYALGVLLYELTTGSTPIARDVAQTASGDRMRLLVCESEPELPSIRLLQRLSDTRDPAEGAANGSRTHGQPQAQATITPDQLRGDLDSIVMKTLERDRGRRYDTAAALADDIERYLRNEPIEARTQSSLYRCTKFVKRNKLLVSSLTAIASILVAAVAFSTTYAIQAKQAQDLADLRYESERAAKDRAVEAESLAAEGERRASASERHTQALLHAARLRLVGRSLQDADYAAASFTLRDPNSSLSEEQRAAFPFRHLWQVTHGQPRRLVSGLEDIYCMRTLDAERLIIGTSMGEIYIVGDSGQLELLGTSSAGVFDLELSPDGSRCATIDRDGQVAIWDLTSRTQTGQFDAGSVSALYQIEYADAGNLILTCGDNEAIKLWNSRTLTTAGVLRDRDTTIEAIAVSPDDRYVVSGSRDQLIRLWDLQQRSLLKVLRGHDGRIPVVAFSHDSQYFASGGLNAKVIEWSVKSLSAVAEHDGHRDKIEALAYSPDDRYLVSGDKSGSARLWPRIPTRSVSLRKAPTWFAITDAGRIVGSSKDEIFHLDSDGSELRSVSMELPAAAENATDSPVVAGSADGRTLVRGALIWRLDQQWQLPHPEPDIQARTVSDDGETVAVALRDSRVQVFDLAGPQLELVCDVQLSGQTTDLCFAQQAQLIACLAVDGRVTLIDPRGERPVHTEFDSGFLSSGMSISSDARFLAGRLRSSVVRLWRNMGGVREFVDLKFSSRITSTELGADGTLLVHGPDACYLWDCPHVRSLAGWSVKLDPRISPAARLSPDGRRVALMRADRQLELGTTDGYSMGLMEPRAMHVSADRIWSVCFRADTPAIVMGDGGGRVVQFDLDQASSRLQYFPYVTFDLCGDELAVAQVHRGTGEIHLRRGDDLGYVRQMGHVDRQLYSIDYSEDRRTIATGHAGGQIHIWDAQQGRSDTLSTGNEQDVVCVAVASDGRLLVSGDYGGQLVVWDLHDGTRIAEAELEIACQDVKLAPDGSHVAVALLDDVILYRLPDLRRMRVLSGHRNTAACVEYAPDGQWLVSASHDRSLKIWNPMSGELLTTVVGFSGPLRSVSVSPDAATIATCDELGYVGFAQPSTGQLLLERRVSEARIDHVQFSHSGGSLYVNLTSSGIKRLDAPAFDRHAFELAPFTVDSK